MINPANKLDPIDNLSHQLHFIGGIADLIESVVDCGAERFIVGQIYCCAGALRGFVRTCEADLSAVTDELKGLSK